MFLSIMDLKDKKLLFVLSKNSRLSYTALAKLTGLSRDVVKYRIDKLKSSGIIKGFRLILDYNKFGIKEYDVHFRFADYNEQNEKHIIAYFMKNPFITWIGTCFGSFDMKVSIRVEDEAHLSSLLEKMKSDLDIIEQELVFVSEKYKTPSDVFLHTLFPELKDFKPEIKLLSKKNDHSPDDIDNKIIVIMGKDPTIGYAAIAKKIELTPEAVKYRVSALEQGGIIKGYSIIINGPELGVLSCQMLVKLQEMKETETLRKYIENSRQLTSSVKLMGKWDLGITFYAKDMKQIRNIILDFRNTFSKYIKEYDSLIIFETHKHPSIAEGVFNR